MGGKTSNGLKILCHGEDMAYDVAGIEISIFCHSVASTPGRKSLH